MTPATKLSPALAALFLLAACGQAGPTTPTPSTAASSPSPSAAAKVAAGSSPSAAVKPSTAAASSARPSAPAASPSALAKVNSTYTAVSATSAPEWIAAGAGLFRKHGLDVSMPFLAPATLTAGLIGGSVDLGFGSPGSVATAVAQGADLTIIGATYEGSTFSIVARADIKALSDLKGKKVSATQRGATTDFLIRRVAQEQGFGPSDINIVYIPESAAMIPALSTGAVDAAVLTEPQTSVALALPGIHAIFSPDSQGANAFISMSVLITRKSIIPAHRDVFKRFLMANIEGVHIARTNPDEAAKYMAPYLKIEDLKVVRSSLDGVQKVLRDDFSVTTPGLQSVLDSTAIATPDVAKLKPQDLADLSLVDEIKASGFLATLK